MPKLKAGDTFVFTREMLEEKGQYSCLDKYVGETITIRYINHENDYGYEGFYFKSKIIDKFLREQPAKRLWRSEFVSSDGITIKEGKVGITIQDRIHIFTPEALNKLANQIRAAKLQLKKLK